MTGFALGQPLKLLKPGVKDKILAALSRGASYQIACGYAGISYETLRSWIRRAEQLLELVDEEIEKHPDKIYFDFYCHLKHVESVAALKWLEKIDNASTFHWQAAAWKLSKRYPEEFGTAKDETEKKVEDTAKAVQELRELIAKRKAPNE